MIEILRAFNPSGGRSPGSGRRSASARRRGSIVDHPAYSGFLACTKVESSAEGCVRPRFAA
jgi:hypothetical protein